MQVVNPLNPGGIRATLERWYADPTQQSRWVTFDGVSVSLRDDLGSMKEGERSICLVNELGSLVRNEIDINELLYNDY